MSWRELLDYIWMTRKRALAQGFTHEGTHFGVPVFCEYDERSEGMGMVVAKSWPLELVISIGCAMLGTINAFREPGDELRFAFKIKPIPGEDAP